VSSRIYKTEGIVLKSSPYGEGHLLVTILTREGSKLRAMAWGARKPTSRKVGHLEPLTRVDLALTKGRDMDSITQAQNLEGYVAIKSDLEATAKALYLAELAEAFANQDSPNPALYRLFSATLQKIASAGTPELLVPYFQLNLLKVTGFMPEVYRCVECRKGVTPGQHRFSVDLGGLLCTQCRPSDNVRLAPLSIEALRTLRFLHISEVGALATVDMPAALVRELRSLLDSSLRYWLDRDVRAKGFMDHIGATASLKA
jgi:DNA repair protein RecO (recombination protein O)